MVFVKGDGASVVEERIDFNDELVLAPEKVDLPTPNLDVGLREREVVAVNECKEVFLDV